MTPYDLSKTYHVLRAVESLAVTLRMNAEDDDNLDNVHVPFKTVGTRVVMSSDRYRELTDELAHLRDRVEADKRMIAQLVEALGCFVSMAEINLDEPQEFWWVFQGMCEDGNAKRARARRNGFGERRIMGKGRARKCKCIEC